MADKLTVCVSAIFVFDKQDAKDKNNDLKGKLWQSNGDQLG